MLKVERPPLAAETLARCALEREKAIAHYSKSHAEADADFSFREYKNPAIAEALEKLFHGKCAYCETVIATVQPTDIEHYRPKGGVIINSRLKKPGYYWLAADWDNLLPSCIFCNRPNRHELPEHERKRAVGKGNEFPLEDDARRVSRHDENIENEVPLILNPCGPDDPDEHLAFEPDGSVRARKIGNTTSAKGEATIRHLALQRPALRRERKKRAEYILANLKQVEQLMPQATTDVDARYFQGQILIRLHSYLQSDEPYIALTRSLIEQQHPGVLANLAAIAERARALPAPIHNPPLSLDLALKKLYRL
ncbi:HNH endonuclease family protein [Rhizobium ruizarguesonis]|uniref:hypothetical protein n=1 Tax=Rhizobium ruizarguesonis TaxID=2081791 RepID=UPI0010308524|nr:hypothetical protein [Rhizobium ruizarguesonis]TBD71744.1 hypothetical protein ELH11_38095 [Rhizobium ruizarguesonis]TBD94901.1 hypothetical protein ELH09_38085 [Rhizobium ruizarguesonis]TBE14559.1 hypothetical protein ELH07_38305 [Rhizobium ruizarguesonis]TBE14743.1 hypothetical protein ELH08_38675 [Rhizobium ruizarguesonis]WSH04961.1 hypothetical protein U8P71_34615 [Rhizobium ruizarguesonis]